VRIRNSARTKVFIVAAALAIGVPAVAASSAPLTTVVVEGQRGGLEAVAAEITKAGGTVVERIDLIDGVIARVPADSVARLSKSKAIKVMSVDTTATVTGTTAPTDGATLSSVTASIGADQIHDRGTDGWGVDIALIDSGVNTVKGIDTASQLISLDDSSPTKTKDAFKKLDQFGHGTHLAGIMLLNDPKKDQVGIAPASRVISMKVADQSGDVSLTSVLQALERIVDQRRANGLNIRIINMSIGFDADSAGGVLVMRAAERAVEQGIVVVASAGNGGAATRSLVAPAASPDVIAVGASDTHGTPDRSDDTVATFTSGSQDGRNPDFVAPGVGIVSARVTGSVIDNNFPGARRPTSRRTADAHSVAGKGTSPFDRHPAPGRPGERSRRGTDRHHGCYRRRPSQRVAGQADPHRENDEPDQACDRRSDDRRSRRYPLDRHPLDRHALDRERVGLGTQFESAAH
jgi:serine protease AprX